MTDDEARNFAEQKLTTYYADRYAAPHGALHTAHIRIDRYDPTDPVVEVMFLGQGGPIAGLRIYRECETDFLSATYVR